MAMGHGISVGVRQMKIIKKMIFVAYLEAATPSSPASDGDGRVVII